MEAAQTVCPVCGVVLTVPPQLQRAIVRCGKCRYRFYLSEQPQITDEDIARWLFEGEEAEFADDAVVARESAVPRESLATRDLVGEEDPLAAAVSLVESHDSDDRDSSRTQTLMAFDPRFRSHAYSRHIRLLKAGTKGALFEFPASQMLDPSFRCSIPRECCRCGVRTHLSAHAIIFSPHLRDSFSLEAEHTAGRLKLDADETQGLTDLEVLNRLSNVPNVPPPGHLPMPYWLCDLCSGQGIISGQIHVNPKSGNGTCRLLIRNLQLAERFVLSNGGEGSRAHERIGKLMQHRQQDPWSEIPKDVKHRLEQWYKPTAAERFVVYVPDRDRARTEEGMAGLVVSSRRLIYHTSFRHKEVSVEVPLDLQVAMAGRAGNLHIRTPNWECRHLKVDRDGIDSLRRALRRAHFTASWR